MSQPREDLLADFDSIVDGYKVSRQDTRKLLDDYAIGHWVSVSERLPEFDEFGYWDGTCTRHLVTGIPESGQWSFEDMRNARITHWLELDLPEVYS